MHKHREIKFRGKRNGNGKRAYGYLVKNTLGAYNIVTEEGTWHEVNEDTVGQGAGLKDKNGKEIYEGDIIQVDGHEENPNYVVHENGGWAFTHDGGVLHHALRHLSKEGYDMVEVIGNLYENPDLLPDEQDD